MSLPVDATLLQCWSVAKIFVLLISTAAIGYGFFLARFLKITSVVVTAFLGLGAMASLSTLSGIAGGYTVPVQSILILLGVVEFFSTIVRLKISIPTFSRKDIPWFIFPVFYFIARFFSAGIPQQHSDPLYYHLSAPKFWAEIGRVQLTSEHPSFAQTGIWESLFGFPQLWLGTTGTSAHVTAQVVAQSLHVLWGQIGCVFLAFVILKNLLADEKKKPPTPVLFFLAWLCTTLPAFEWTGCLAKNEYILLAFLLAAVAAVQDRKIFTAGLLAGFSFATKSLTLWGCVAMVFLFLSRKGFPKTFTQYVLGGALGAFPFVFRNVLWTGNPVFPAFDSVLGPGWLSSYWASHFSAGGGALKWDLAMLPWLWFKGFEKLLPKVLFVTGAVAILIRVVQKKCSRTDRAWSAFVLLQLLMVLLMFRPTTDGRYANYAVVFLLLYLTSHAIRVALSLPREFAATKSLLLFAGLFVNVPLDIVIKIPQEYWFSPAGKYVEQFHLSQEAKTWVQKHTSPHERIFFAAEKINFYIDRPFEAVAEMKKWESVLSQFHSGAELFKGLKQLGYRYLYLNADVEYPPPLRAYWKDLMSYRSKAVFHSSTALVFDLKKL